MPMTCPHGFDTCTTSLASRQRLRKTFTDGAFSVPFSTILRRHVAKPFLCDALPDASPGYFALTLDNDIMMEATATRRAGLERFTFPKGAGKPYFALDLANDSPMSFNGGEMTIDPEKGRVMIGGKWEPRFVKISLLLLLPIFFDSLMRRRWLIG